MKLIDRFWEKVEKTRGCWLWKAGKYPSGYGAIKVSGKVKYAHRLSWEFENGKIPKEMFVLHHCDNRACVNPDHLFLGTQDDNMKDMARKGRAEQGSKRHNAKLTEQQVKEIKNTSGLSQRNIAALYGVSQFAISRILLGRGWRTV